MHLPSGHGNLTYLQESFKWAGSSIRWHVCEHPASFCGHSTSSSSTSYDSKLELYSERNICWEGLRCVLGGRREQDLVC